MPKSTPIENVCCCCCCNAALLAGVRFLDLTDGITVEQRTTCNCVDACQDLRTSNYLVGFQIGGDATLYRCCRFSLESDVKAGIYGNAARNHFAYDSRYFQRYDESGCGAGSAAFVGEFGIRASYQVVGPWSIVAGYELLFIDGLALAYQQPSANTTPLLGPATTVQTGGDVFYQGATLGIECRY